MNRANSLSFWERESFFKDIDIGIIGSGIVGLNAALSIVERDPSVRVAVFERGALPEGASTRNAGFACFGSVTELLDDLTKTSESAVFDLVEMRYRGLQRLRARVGDDAMEYEGRGGYEVFQLKEKGLYEECADKLAYFNKNVKNIIGRDDVYQISHKDFGFDNILPTLIHNTAEGQIHTGKTMSRLLQLCREKGILIYNGLRINKLFDSTEGVVVETEEGWEIFSKKIIVATNGFARRMLPYLEVLPARNQVLVTKPIEGLKLEGCFHYDKGYFYFRNIGNRVLLGGGRNLDFENEMTDSFGTTERIQNALLTLLHETIAPYYKAEIDTWWSGIMGVGPVKKPIIERISPNVVVAVRMGGMGVAIGSLVGEKAANLILS
jgi:glycine/D-amino acid oxidase-like deaminating enzyme